VIDRSIDGVRKKSLKRERFWLDRNIMAASFSGVTAQVKRRPHETCGRLAT
jgi:hypothetical protein